MLSALSNIETLVDVPLLLGLLHPLCQVDLTVGSAGMLATTCETHAMIMDNDVTGREKPRNEKVEQPVQTASCTTSLAPFCAANTLLIFHVQRSNKEAEIMVYY